MSVSKEGGGKDTLDVNGIVAHELVERARRAEGVVSNGVDSNGATLGHANGAPLNPKASSSAPATSTSAATSSAQAGTSEAAPGKSAAPATRPEAPAPSIGTWDDFKKRFDTLENLTAKALEVGLKSRLFLGPTARALTAGLRAKTNMDKITRTVVGLLGLPNKSDQERTLHAIHRLESRLIDLEEKLEDANARANAIVVEAPARESDERK
jgi:hypothetical protein